MVYSRDALDAAFGALADRTRRAILAQLATGDRTIKEIAGGFDMTLPAVSKHLRVLERAGLATVTREGRVRRCRLVATPLRDAAGWIDRYRSFWEASFDRLATYLDATLTEEDPPCLTPRPRQPRRPLRSKSAARSPRRGSASSTRGRPRMR
ncbi:MAG TPA: metalloregulator ArsR/SmtB family transcription factor [Gemmatimonadaceae bacterium]|nr:metalloregulator ArsR/SmtB family transcription factor [Gemmatimonadaceae bacterium]